jgi:hypothetical protein
MVIIRQAASRQTADLNFQGEDLALVIISPRAAHHEAFAVGLRLTTVRFLSANLREFYLHAKVSGY